MQKAGAFCIFMRVFGFFRFSAFIYSLNAANEGNIIRVLPRRELYAHKKARSACVLQKNRVQPPIFSQKAGFWY